MATKFIHVLKDVGSTAWLYLFPVAIVVGLLTKNLMVAWIGVAGLAAVWILVSGLGLIGAARYLQIVRRDWKTFRWPMKLFHGLMLTIVASGLCTIVAATVTLILMPT